jgi:hypothetical protein
LLITKDFVSDESRSWAAEDREVNGTQPKAAYVRKVLQRKNFREFAIQTHSLGKERCPFVLETEFPDRALS